MTTPADQIAIPRAEAQDIVDTLKHFADETGDGDEMGWQAESLAQALARRIPTE